MSSPTTSTPIRRSRLILFTVIVVGALFFYNVPWELPASLLKPKTPAPLPDLPMEEIFGLLHLVTGDREHEQILSKIPDLDTSDPLDYSVYAAGKKDIDWFTEVKKLNEHYPIVVFSKTYCPYSKRAKILLESYNIQPAPKIVEVDLRDDGGILKSLLTRLTGHSTFPNIIIRGKSIGGSDNLLSLHADRSLIKVLERSGAVARPATGKGKGKK